jgi:CheY-like chemotaxis protein
VTPNLTEYYVLVVDDEATIRDLIAEALCEAGYRVETAANGVEAFGIMQRELPRAIVLDLMMPQLDAEGFVELTRLNPQFASIPILVVTAAYAALDAAERLGARACLTKPFELDTLVETVGKIVGEPLPLGAAENGDASVGRQQLPGVIG